MEKAMAPTLVLLPGKSHGRRSLEGCSPWGRWGSDKTERLHFHFSLSCIGERNGNPLQCSCLENSRDSRAWWAAVYGVSQSWTRLTRLSSSSSSSSLIEAEEWISELEDRIVVKTAKEQNKEKGMKKTEDSLTDICTTTLNTPTFKLYQSQKKTRKRKDQENISRAYHQNIS